MEGQNLSTLDNLAADLTRNVQAARQSLVRFTADGILYLHSRLFCAARYKAVFVDGKYHEEPDQKQRQKDLFKYLAFGILDKSGQVPTLPLARGKVSAVEQRIRQQATALRQDLDAHGITVSEAAIKLDYVYSQAIRIEARVDALGECEGEPVVLFPTMTSSIHNGYERGGSMWGRPWDMDHTEAYLITGIQQALAGGAPYAILYLVYEYTPKMESKLVKIPVDALKRAELIRLIEDAWQVHCQSAEAGFAPAPAYEKCATCPVEDCAARVRVKPIQEMYH
jgi:hypothetical protein